MNTKIKIFAIALVGIMMFSTSCQKEKDNIKESLGVLFAVDINGHPDWDSNTSNATISATMDGSRLKVTIKNGNKEVILHAKEFVKGKYIFDSQKHINTGIYKDGSKTFEGASGGDNYLEIKYIHTDGKTFDGRFSFVCTDGTDIKTVHGTWANVKR